MIIVKVSAGLGNQMFQYACGRALSLRNSDTLALEMSYFDAPVAGDTPRAFALDAFSVVYQKAAPRSYIATLYSKIIRKLTKCYNIGFNPNILTKKGNVFLEGYFQSEKYFADFASVIRKDFTPRAPLSTSADALYAQIIADKNAVSLHVRRGDYVTHKDFGGIANLEYFERAIETVHARVPHAHFYVFSDDITWCKENLPHQELLTFVSKPSMKDYEELWLMSRCIHHIIGNSSFAWWGAWLNPHPDKIVIAPTRWANGDAEKNFRDIIPDSWTRL